MKKILSIKITGSSFYRDLEITLSEKLNCIMGGRGAGKTTLLYFIKASLERDIEKSKVISSLLQENLGDGKIELEIESESGHVYKIDKSFNELPNAYVNNDFIFFENILQELQCDFYEAQAIEEIGRNGLSRLQLIDKMIINDVHNLMDNIVSLQFEAHQNAHEIKNLRLKIHQISESSKNYDDVLTELKNLKKFEPTGLSSSDKDEFEKAIDNEKKRDAENRYLTKLTEKNFEFLKAINKIGEEIDEFLKKNLYPVSANLGSVLNKIELEKVTTGSINAYKDVLFKQKESAQLIASTLSIIQASTELVKNKHEQQQSELVQLKQKYESHKEYINRYNNLSKQAELFKSQQLQIEELLKKIAILKRERSQTIDNLNEQKQQLFHKRVFCSNQINKTFNGTILININFGGLKDEFESNLKEGLKGSGLRYNELIPKIVDNFTPDQFAKVICEKDRESLKTISGIDDLRSEAIINALYETDIIYFIESIYCPDLPDFLLRINRDSKIISENYKRSDFLSMGQRCTAVLPVVFAVSQNPLIIDQPEDNLDNRYIYESIHEIIRNQKETRQLIFITHNANIPVLSESENNIFLSFENKSEIIAKGTVQEVKGEIINLLEGGEDAFLRRKSTYGY